MGVLVTLAAAAAAGDGACSFMGGVWCCAKGAFSLLQGDLQTRQTRQDGFFLKGGSLLGRLEVALYLKSRNRSTSAPRFIFCFFLFLLPKRNLEFFAQDCGGGAFGKAHPMQPSPEMVGQLLRQVQHGSGAAVTALLDLLGPWIRLLIHSHLDARVLQHIDADDIFQDVCQALIPLLGTSTTIQKPKKFFAYVAGIVHHQTLSANRRYLDFQKRQLQVEDLDSESALMNAFRTNRAPRLRLIFGTGGTN